MNVVEALMAQRDALLFGEWVRCPAKPNEACAVVRIDEHGKYHSVSRDNLEAGCLLSATCRRLFGMSPVPLNYEATTTLDDLLTLFDEAIRMAKEEKP